MDNGAKGARVHEIAQLIIVVKSLDIMQIEIQRTINVLVDGTGREEPLASIAVMPEVHLAQGLITRVGHTDVDIGRRLHDRVHFHVLQRATIHLLELGNEA